MASSSNVISKRRFRKLGAIRSDVDFDNILSKTVQRREMSARHQGINRSVIPSGGFLQSVSDSTVTAMRDANNIKQLIPDTEMAIQVLVSSILSPKDLVSTEIGYRINNSEIPAEISGVVLDVIRTYFDETYKIEKKLSVILEEILANSGAYIQMVMPESSVDRMINGDTYSMESLQDFIEPGGTRPRISMGILGKGKNAGKSNELSLESMGAPFKPNLVTSLEAQSQYLPESMRANLTITDNPLFLKWPAVRQRLRKERMRVALETQGMQMSMEARSDRTPRGQMTHDEIERATFKKRNYSPAPYSEVTIDHSRESQGHPLVVKLSSDAVIPVHTPSDPSDHIAYFVLIDQNGNPLSRAKNSDYYGDLRTNLGGNNLNTQMLQQAKVASLGGSYNNDTQLNDAEMLRVYTELVEKDLLTRMASGLVGEDVELARPQEVYRIMFSRMLAQKQTQLLYVPAELMSYMAFDFNDYGVGKTLFDDNRILAGVLAMLFFANTMGAIKNSIGRTGLKITLDADDPDPQETVEFLIQEYVRQTQGSYPLGASNPTDVINYLQNAAVDVNVTGNTRYPETTMDVEDRSSQKVAVDSELEQNLRDRFFMSLGISPETIDLSRNVEFATSIVSSNLLLAKRVTMYQDKFTPLLSDFIKMFTLNSGTLLDQIRDRIKNIPRAQIPKEYRKAEQADDLLFTVIDALEVTLPRPDTVTLENQMTAYQTFTDALNQALDAYFSNDLMSFEEMEDIQAEVDGTRAALEAYFKRNWLRDNNVLPEVADLIAFTDDEEPVLDMMEIHGNHLKAIGKSIGKFMKEMRKARAKREERLGEEGEGGATPPTEASDDDFDASFGDDTGGGDDGLTDDGTDDTDDAGATDDDTDDDTTPTGPADGDDTTTHDDDLGDIPTPP